MAPFRYTRYLAALGALTLGAALYLSNFGPAPHQTNSVRNLELKVKQLGDYSKPDPLIGGRANYPSGLVISPSLGRITRERSYPNSDLTVVYIKEIHKNPVRSEVEQVLKENSGKDGCKIFREYAAGADVGAGNEEHIKRIIESCDRLEAIESKVIDAAKHVPSRVQKNVYEILKSLRQSGLGMVGLEGAYSSIDGDFNIPRGGEKDIRARCSRFGQKAAVCEKRMVDGLIEKGGDAALVFELYNTDEVLTVGLEDPRLHKPSMNYLKDVFSGRTPEITNEAFEEIGVKRRSEYAAKTMVETMRKNGKKFGAIVFGGGHTDIADYLEQMKVSYAVIEPAAYTQTKGLQKNR